MTLIHYLDTAPTWVQCLVGVGGGGLIFCTLTAVAFKLGVPFPIQITVSDKASYDKGYADACLAMTEWRADVERRAREYAEGQP